MRPVKLAVHSKLRDFESSPDIKRSAFDQRKADKISRRLTMKTVEGLNLQSSNANERTLAQES